MKISIDSQIIKACMHYPNDLIKNPFLSNCDHPIRLGWPSLFEYLELGSVLSNLAPFDQTDPVLAACISALYVNDEKEVLYYIYDQLFVENLHRIQALPEIKASFLLQAIKNRRQQSFVLEESLSPELDAIEAAFQEDPAHTIHDLVLYLAWDRMCVCMIHLFNYPSSDPKFTSGIEVLKDCLVESYLHIAQQGRTFPGIYRMIESLFFYQMREENLQKHTDIAWKILSQSFQELKATDAFVDFFYIDHAVSSEGKYLNPQDENLEYYLTLDSPEKVNARLSLAQYMIEKLKEEVPQWIYALSPKKIIYLCQDK